MTFEFEVLKKRIAELKAKNAELEAKKTELLKQIIEENTKRNASLPIEKQSYNDNPSNDSISNFNSVVKYYEKPLVNVKTNNSFPEEVCYNKQELITEVTVSVNSVKYLNSKSLEKKDMNSFLLEAHKKIISSEIKQYNKKKFLRESAKNQ
ncbi:2174_t:CDS:2, partial [Rhizophagus irregularis]